MKKCSSVYRRKGQLLIATTSLTVDDFWVTVPPYWRLEESVSPTEIGSAIVDAVNASKSGIPTPPLKGSPGTQALLDAAGVRSYSTFMKGALLVEVEVEDQWARLIPMINMGGKGGFGFPDDTTALHARFDDLAQLAQKALDALALAT